MTNKSIAEKGTLSQIRNAYNHRGVTSDVMNCYNHCDDLLRFVTYCHVCLLALTFCNMDFASSPQCGTPGSRQTDSKADRQTFLWGIATRIVHFVCQLPSQEEINNVVEADLTGGVNDEWCVCDEGKFFFSKYSLSLF